MLGLEGLNFFSGFSSGIFLILSRRTRSMIRFSLSIFSFLALRMSVKRLCFYLQSL